MPYNPEIEKVVRISIYHHQLLKAIAQQTRRGLQVENELLIEEKARSLGLLKAEP